MKSIKLSFFLNMEIKPFILGAFLSRTTECENDGRRYFYTYTSYKSSKYVFPDDFDFESYPEQLISVLNQYSGHHNWTRTSVTPTQAKLCFYIQNDLEMSKDVFYKTLYGILLNSNWLIIENESAKADFIRGFMELRGSVDTKLKFLTQDYFYSNKRELKKALLLPDVLDIPVGYMNLNARELQPQYVEGTNKRNTQFRINLFYYANKIGFLNDYKAKIFENAYHPKSKSKKNDITYFDVEAPTPRTYTSQFINNLNFFTNNIYERDLTEELVEKLREQLGINNQSEASSTTNRSQALVEVFNRVSPDKCALCGTTKTFADPNTGRQQFEIHHVISVHNGKQYDNMANLVKLCTTCHDSLKRGRSSKEDQIKSIITILHGNPVVYEFCSEILDIDNINDLAERIQEMLG